MAAYFRKLDDQVAPTWVATTSAGSFLASVVQYRAGEWTVETGKAAEATVHLKAPSLEAALDFVSEQLVGLVSVK